MELDQILKILRENFVLEYNTPEMSVKFNPDYSFGGAAEIEIPFEGDLKDVEPAE